jgi:SAM-dependent methyltransferase
MKYQPFTPEPARIAAQILAQQPAADAREDGPDAAPIVTVAVAPEPARDIPTTLEALTALRDRAFVQAAYRVLLGREVDPSGLASFVHQLRSGALDKVDILGDLRRSPEGQQRAVTIPGLDWRYNLRRLGRRRGIGWVVRWFLALARLPHLLQIGQRHQAEIEQASVVAEEHAAAIQLIGTELRELRERTRTMATRIQTAEGALSELFGGSRAISTRVDALGSDLGTLRGELAAAGRRIASTSEELAAAAKALDVRIQRLGAANVRVIQQLQDIRSAASPVVSAVAPAPSAESARPLPPVDLDDWYVAFEDHFRGSREDTKRSQEVYLDYVAAARAGTAAAPILDVGCGRGEWLELLREHGSVARGVDLNRAMVLDNRRRGLDVVERDVLTELGALPDDSLGMVTGFHIIEHLPFELLVRLFDECRRVLRPGGCILFETPNPENLVVGAYTFYFDPTHRNPLPPLMTEFLVQQRGFAQVEILRLHPRQEEGSDPALLDKWFRGATDYAVIGWKDGRGAVPDRAPASTTL